jgi:hypothetical protein
MLRICERKKRNEHENKEEKGILIHDEEEGLKKSKEKKEKG